MGYIGSLPSDLNSGAKPRNDFTGDGTTSAFTLSQSVPGGFESNVIVIVDNVIQQPLEAYTITGANYTTLQFSEAPAAGAVVYVLHQGNATQFVAPSTGSVGASALADNLRNFTVDTFTGNGSDTAFTLTETPISANSILVIVDGILQTRTTNYTLATNVVTFTGAPDNGSAITVIHLGFSTISRTGVVDGSITPVKLSSGAPIWDISGNVTYTGGLTGGTGVINIGSGQFYKAVGGNIGVNTITPSSTFGVKASGANGIVLEVDGSDNASSTRIFGKTTTSTGAIFYYDNGGNPIWAITNSAVVGSATGTTNLTVSKNGLALGNYDAASSGIGIKFPATQSASSDANTLDDYEEGTWTPVDGSGQGIVFTSAQGTFTKIGRIVTCFMNVTYPTNSNGLQSTIAGLPFASAASPANPGGGYVLYNTAGIANLTTPIGGTGAQFSLYTTGGGQVTNATMSNAILRLAIVYQAAS